METLLKELSKYNLSGWMIFILLLIFVISYFYKKPISELLTKFKTKKERDIKELVNHDLFNTLNRVRLEVKNMKFYSHGQYDAVKTKMCYDFTIFKTQVCNDRFEKLLERDLNNLGVDQLKSDMLNEINDMHIEYIGKTTAHWLSKGLSVEDVNYIVELFERFRYDVVQSFSTRIDAVFSSSYHDTNFKKMLACFDMFAMGVDLLPNDMQVTFETLNGKFLNLKYK
jgi:hypothetical protein